jgi:hypothetical protein
MKRIPLFMFFLTSGLFSVAQKVTIDKNGNYIAVKDSAAPDTKTGKTYTDTKGIKYPVYATKAGKLYVIKTSAKTGKSYKMYLKL